MPFVDPRKTPFVPIHSRGELPHLYKDYGTYFITTRAYDAVLPCARRLTPVEDSEAAPESLMEGYDPPVTLGSCPMNHDAVSEMMKRALLFHSNSRYELRAWCFMPNHVHLVMQTRENWSLDKVMRDWKGYTSREANKILTRKGAFWERESFDHLIRTPEGVAKFVAYTENNPVAAGLCATPEEWRYSSAHRSS